MFIKSALLLLWPWLLLLFDDNIEEEEEEEDEDGTAEVRRGIGNLSSKSTSQKILLSIK